MTRPPRRRRPPSLDLALQGGGSHGAFTWGALDRLLEEDGTLALQGVSGTSAGALNAGVLASGYAAGGAAGARRALDAFWLDVAAGQGCFGAGAAAWPMPGLAAFNLDLNPWYAWFTQFTRLASPYQFNPLDLNPLRMVAERHVDVDALRRGPLAVFVTATAVRTGQPRVFSGAELSIDALLASACLPQLFRAVQIGGQPYWDGGYSGNPALWPLIYNTPSLDILLVKINPLVRPGTPDTAEEIADRVNEITFNAGLVGEMRAIAFVQRLVAEGRLDGTRYKNLRLHMIGDEKGLAPLHPSSKLNTDRRFLESLRDLGRAAATRWLAAHRGDIGRRSTLDVAQTFLAPRDRANGG
jgi:NTE family protein